MHRAIIILLLVGLMVSCRSTPEPSVAERAALAFDELRNQIRIEIADTQKRERLIGYADELEGISSQASHDRRELGDQLTQLNRRYDADAADFEAVFLEVNARREARQQRLMALLDEARSLMSEDEWRSVNKFKTMALKAALAGATSDEVSP